MGYRVKGSTDKVTTCQECGRPAPRGTVILAITDAAGTELGATHASVSCAATLAGTSERRIRGQAAAAMLEARGRLQWAAQQLGRYAAAADNPAALAVLFFAFNPHLRQDLVSRPAWTDFDACHEALIYLRQAREITASGGIPPAGSSWPSLTEIIPGGNHP